MTCSCSKNPLQILLALLLLNVSTFEVSSAQEPVPAFEKLLLSEAFQSEGADFADFNHDGEQDIVSGPYWYAGPDFRQRHRYAEQGPYSIKGYSDYFFCFAHDFNGDGFVDVLSIPMPGTAAYWHENPGVPEGKNGEAIWKRHQVLATVDNESPALIDFVGDGRPELVCNHQGAFGYATPNWNAPTEPWKFTPVTPAQGYGRFTHGLGIGDVNGDGRNDLLETNGWWEQPADAEKLFEFHPFQFAQSGGSQMFAYDFDGDGDNDILSTQNAHGWGLSWFERRGTGDDYLFVPHEILPSKEATDSSQLSISQMHAVALTDIDGDGVKDVITGKRFWAHGGNDPGAKQLPVLYWFRTKRTDSGVEFEPNLIDTRSGVGTQLTVGDLTGNGRTDIIVGNKAGTFAMLNRAADASSRQTTKAILPKAIDALPGSPGFGLGIRSSEAQTPEKEQVDFCVASRI